MADNTLNIEVLPDGTLKIESSEFAMAEHKTADEFLREVERLMGGDVLKSRIKETHGHTQTHRRIKQ